MGGRGFEQVELVTEDGLATVRLNRPDRYNALGARIVEELGEALDEVEGTGEARVMILTGAGDKAFCSGVDLKERAAMDADERWAHNRALNAFAERLARLQVPTIAALNGLAFGGGLEITLACDFRIAVEGATFSLPEVGIGIVPGAGGTQRLPRLIGPTRAKEMILTGRRIDAATALEMGLVGKVVPPSELMQEAQDASRGDLRQQPLRARPRKGGGGPRFGDDDRAGTALRDGRHPRYPGLRQTTRSASPPSRRSEHRGSRR